MIIVLLNNTGTWGWNLFDEYFDILLICFPMFGGIVVILLLAIDTAQSYAICASILLDVYGKYLIVVPLHCFAKCNDTCRHVS